MSQPHDTPIKECWGCGELFNEDEQGGKYGGYYLCDTCKPVPLPKHSEEPESLGDR